ncbi:MAG: hypothetical protein KUG75_10580 [Pseudomonadales bacterium]|nr:hypothetical protein [Pseudomonadales bacterium]
MHDGVLQTATEVLLAHEVNCLRFNFRGVGASSGNYDGGRGEVQDLLAASAAVEDMYPDDKIWWLGYSFGAAVVWRSLQQQLQQKMKDGSESKARLTIPQRCVLIAPPVSMIDMTPNDAFTQANAFKVGGSVSVNTIAGDQDDFVDVDKIRTWPGVSTSIISGADHFFSGCQDTLASTLADVLFS